MNYLPYYKSNLRLAVPVIISQVGQMSVQLVDTIMVGHINSQELAAVAFANTLATPVLLFGTAAAMGLTPLVGRSHAMGNYARTTSLFQNSLVLNLGLGALMSLVILAAMGLMGSMGQDPAILPTARAYIVYQMLSCLPMMMFATGKQFLEGLGNTTYSMAITITGNVLNVGLNFALIYGLWFFPEMGAVGAGASTFYSRVFMVTLFGIVFFRKSKYKKYLDDFSHAQLTRFRIRRLMNVGLPIAAQVFIEVAAMSLMALAVGMFGATSLAAHQIAINIPSMSFMVITGLASATTIRVSQDYGLKLYAQMKYSVIASVHLIIGFTILTSILIFVFAAQIAGVFNSEPAVIAAAANFLILGAIFQIPDGVQGVLLGALRGLVEVKRPMYFAVFVYVFVAIPLGYFLSFQLGVGAAGSWIGFIVALCLLCGLYGWQFVRRYRQLMALERR